MAFGLGKFAAFCLLLSATGSTLALGLGNAAGQPVLGQPLLIEIPLLGTEEGVPPLECFRIRPPSVEIESAFVLRNAQLQLQGERNHARLILASASVVREPVIEFGLAVGCGFALSKDYLLLSAEPFSAALPAQQIRPLLTAEPTSKPADPPRQQGAVQAAGATATPLRADGDSTLAELARQRYPLQPKAREKFLRMMLQANPDLKQLDAPLIAGAELKFPPGLPVRRLGAYRPESKPAAAADQPRAPTAAISPGEAGAKQPAAAAKPQQDLLVLGAPGQRRTAAELLAEAERLTAMLIEQTNTQNAAVAKISELEGNLNALKQHVGGLESRIHAIEAERQAEKLAPKPVSLDFVELLLAVLLGGVAGGLALHFHNRRKSRREEEQKKPRSGPLAQANPQAAMAPAQPRKPLQSEGLQWQEGFEQVRKNAAQGLTGALPETGEGPKQRPLTKEDFQTAKSTSTPQNDFDFVSKS